MLLRNALLRIAGLCAVLVTLAGWLGGRTRPRVKLH